MGEENKGEGESASTVIPVVLGDNGDAIMGEGKVRRLRYVGVLYCSTAGDGLAGGVDGRSDEEDEEPVGSGEL